MSGFDDLARAALDRRRDEGLFRERQTVRWLGPTRVEIAGRTLVQFCANDYLGLASNGGSIDFDRAGSGSAPLIGGHAPAHAAAEAKLAAWKGVESAALLPSGYQANVAAVGGMAGAIAAAGRRPRFLLDKLCHASLIDAVRSTEAELRVVPHNGLAKLERLLSDRPAETSDVVVTESIFSMDGDAADLAGIARLRERLEFGLIVDEAHATGLYGPDGAGLTKSLGVRADVGIATFSKAAGVIGGAVYGTATAVASVVNFGRAFIYSTAIPPLVATLIERSIDAMKSADEARESLRQNVARLRAGIAKLGLESIAGDSPIVPVILGDARRTLDAAAALRDAGFYVVAVRPPTVAPGTSRLRLTVSSRHAAAEIDALLSSLSSIVSGREAR